MGGCCSSSVKTDEKSKDAAAKALQVAAAGHLQRSKEKSEKLELEAAEEQRLAREAEAATLLQRAAAAHIAMQEPPKPPALVMENVNPVAQLIDSARFLFAGASDAVRQLTGADNPAAEPESESATGATSEVDAATTAKVMPPSLAIPDRAEKEEETAGIDFIDSARFLFQKANEAIANVITSTPAVEEPEASAPATAAPSAAPAEPETAAPAPTSPDCTAAAAPAAAEVAPTTSATASGPDAEPTPPTSAVGPSVPSPSAAPTKGVPAVGPSVPSPSAAPTKGVPAALLRARARGSSAAQEAALLSVAKAKEASAVGVAAAAPTAPPPAPPPAEGTVQLV